MNLDSFVGESPGYEPLILSPRSQKELSLLHQLKHDPSVQLLDTIENQVAELIKINHPSQVFEKATLQGKVNEFFEANSRETYGVWVYYPWRNQLVHILEEDDFIQLRTSRNRYKITQEEQDVLRKKKIGVIGLSVGQSVALSLAMERSFGELRIADFDTLELSNMNRIRTGVCNLGLKKTWMVAREIAEIDPFLKVKVFDEGIHEGNMDDFFEEGGRLDLLVEECDTLPVKIGSRLKAKELGIPVLMDTSDRGMIDIERFDIEPERPIFHGMLEKFGDEGDLMKVLTDNYKEILFSILHYEELSPQLQYSMGEIGKSITTWPQTASSVIMGGAVGAYYSRLILLNKGMPSKRLYVDLDLIKEN